MTDTPDRILRLKTVLERTGFNRSTMYRKMQNGTLARWNLRPASAAQYAAVSFTASVEPLPQPQEIDSLTELLRLINGGARLADVRIRGLTMHRASDDAVRWADDTRGDIICARALACVTSVRMADKDELLTSKLDRREIDDLGAWIAKALDEPCRRGKATGDAA